MKNLEPKKIFTYVSLIGVLALIIVYFLVYKKYNDMTDALVSENNSLSSRVAVLKEYYDNKQMYQEAIDAMDADINIKLDTLPADVKEEDILMLAVDTMRSNVIAYTNITVADREPVYEIDRGVVGAAQIEGLSDTLTFVKRSVNYVNNVDYFNLKSVVRQIQNSPGKKNLAVVSYKAEKQDKAEDAEKASEPETEFLDGTITVQYYSILGTGKPYVKPDIKDYEAGLFDIFGFKSESIVNNGL